MRHHHHRRSLHIHRIHAGWSAPSSDPHHFRISRLMHRLKRETGVTKQLFEVRGHVIPACDSCLRFMSQIHVSDSCLRFMSQIHVSDSCLRFSSQLTIKSNVESIGPFFCDQADDFASCCSSPSHVPFCKRLALLPFQSTSSGQKCFNWFNVTDLFLQSRNTRKRSRRRGYTWEARP